MLKKAVILGSVMSSVCAAPTMAGPCYFKSGFLAGAHVGVTNGWGRFNSTFSINPALPVNSSLASGSARKTAFLLGVFGAYRYVFNQEYMIGVNLEANSFMNNELNKELEHFAAPPPGVGANNRLRKHSNIMPSISFGKIFCDRWYAYIGLGLAVARFKQQVTISIPAAPSLSVSGSRTSLGFVPSLGVEYAVTRDISLSGSINYEIYKKLSNSLNVNVPVVLTPSSYASSISPKDLTFKVGVGYRF